MERWRPHEEIDDFIRAYGYEFRGFVPIELYRQCELYKAPWFWLAGITLHEDLILFDDDVYDSQNRWYQAQVIYHELVHVAQQKTMPQGLPGFFVTYGFEWVRAGFSYERMKEFGIEAEAIRETRKFRGDLYSAKGEEFYANRTDFLVEAWLKKEPLRKAKRPRVRRRKKPGKAR
jgi:hypothetical protein